MELRELKELMFEKKTSIENTVKMLKNDKLVADRLHHKIQSMSLQEIIDYFADVHQIIEELIKAVNSLKLKDPF